MPKILFSLIIFFSNLIKMGKVKNDSFFLKDKLLKSFGIIPLQSDISPVNLPIPARKIWLFSSGSFLGRCCNYRKS